jgi:hypothetical protein
MILFKKLYKLYCLKKNKDKMSETLYYHTLSHKDGKQYYFAQKSGLKAHRIDRETYENHLKHDDHHGHDSSTTTPKFWAVGTQGNDGSVKYVYLTRKHGDKHTYEITPRSFHGNFDSDPDALERIGEVLTKHKAVLQETSGKHSEIPMHAIYNLNGRSAQNRGSMSVPSIVADEIHTAAAFSTPYTALMLTSLKYVKLHVDTSSRRECYDKAQAETASTKYFDTDAFTACLGDNCEYALMIMTYDASAYQTMEKILKGPATKPFFPELFDHWPCKDKKLSYWLFNVKGLQQLSNEESAKAELQKKAKEFLSKASFQHLHFDKKADGKFERNEFLKKPDGSLVYFDLASISFFDDVKTVQFAGKSDDSASLKRSGNFADASKLDEQAMEKFLV